MQATFPTRENAHTFLVHLVGDGLSDTRFVVERFLSRVDGRIVAVGADGAPPRGMRKPPPAIVSRKAVEELRPEPNEIIIATGLKLLDSGIQLWGSTAA